jgi:hypothetical protein
MATPLRQGDRDGPQPAMGCFSKLRAPVYIVWEFGYTVELAAFIRV